MPAFSTKGLGSESIAMTYPFGPGPPPNPLVRFLPCIPGTRRAIGAKEFHNTEEKVCYFNIVVCMHGSLAGKTTHGKISPVQKSTRSEGIANFSVLPSPILPTSKSSKVRVIDVQRPSDRYYARNFICPLCTAPCARRLASTFPYDVETSNVALVSYIAHCRTGQKQVLL